MGQNKKQLPADQRWVAVSEASQSEIHAGHPPTQPSSQQPQPLQGQELLKMDPSQETDRHANTDGGGGSEGL